MIKIKLPGFIERYLHRQKGLEEYEKTIKSFLSDSELSIEENNKLLEIKKQFDLPDDELKKIHQTSVSGVFKDMASDKRITEQEKESFVKLLNHFNLSKSDVQFSQENFNKFYTLALIDKGVLPKIDNNVSQINILFKDGEILHWGMAARLLKRKRVTHRVNYGGFTGSIRIMKGVNYRAGSIGMRSVSSEIMATEDAGMLYITNQRVGYIGYRKQFSFPFAKISSLELREEGLHIFKEGKEVPYILDLDDYEVALAIISFILNKE